MLVANAMKPREPSDNIGATYATYTFNDGVFLILFFLPHLSGIGSSTGRFFFDGLILIGVGGIVDSCTR